MIDIDCMVLGERSRVTMVGIEMTLVQVSDSGDACRLQRTRQVNGLVSVGAETRNHPDHR